MEYDQSKVGEFLAECQEFASHHNRRDLRRPKVLPLLLWRWLARRRRPVYKWRTEVFEYCFVMVAHDTEYIRMMYLSAWGDWKMMKRYRIVNDGMMEEVATVV